MVLGEAEPAAAGGGRRPHRQALLVHQLHRRVPAARRVDVRAGDQHRVGRVLEGAGEVLEGDRVGQRPRVDASQQQLGEGVLVGRLVPVVHRDRHERRPAGGQRGVVDRPGDRLGDVLGAGRFVGPLDVRLGAEHRFAVGEVGLEGDLGSHLLAGGDQQRGLVGLGVEDPADRVPDPGGRVQVGVCGAAAGLGVAVGHSHHHQLLQAEDVGEVLRVLLQHRQLGGARVAEDARHAVGAQHLEGCLPDRAHRERTLTESGGRRSRAAALRVWP